MNKQKCSKCKEEKLYEEFYKDKRNPRGIKYQCKKCVGSHSTKYYKENKAKRKEYAKKYYQENKEYIINKSKSYYKENREAQCARQALYSRNHQEERRKQKRQYKHRRRARMLENGIEDFTTKQLNEHWIKKGIDPESCYYCDEGEYEHLDHYVPIVKGGPHFMSNLRPSCASCNRSKHAKDPEEWIASRL